MNYRKGGVPFLNLVSIIPIPWDNPDEIQFHVGFQVDLVHQPNAILQTMRDGSYLVNYSTIGGPSANSLNQGRNGPFRRGDMAGTLSHSLRELLALTTPGGASEVAKNTDEQIRSDFNAMLLDNADGKWSLGHPLHSSTEAVFIDFVHVFSVKGILQYASPSLLRALEYTLDELVGRSIGEIAHPQDLTPVMRELKEASSFVETPTSTSLRPVQKTVQLLFRVRRKRSGFVWLESSGRLHMEPGKTRKSIIFSGRLRELPAFNWGSVAMAGGLAPPNDPSSSNESESEFWAKVSSVTALFLFAESKVAEVLGSSAEEMVGTSFLDVVDDVDKARVIESIHNYIANDTTGDPYTLSATLISRADARRHPMDIVVYPPLRSDAGAAVIKPASPSSYIVQFRPRRNGFVRAKSTVHASTSKIYDELDVSRGTNWNYERETIRQNNEQFRTEIANLLAERSRVAVS